jgi:hypothetical protein
MTINKRKGWLMGLLLLMAAQSVLAADAYLKGGANYMWVKVDGDRFSPLAAELSGGWYVDKQVAIELQYAQGVKDANKLSIRTELDYQAGVSLRLESPEVDGGRLYFLGGYAITHLDVNRSGTGLPGALEFKGGNFGLGVQLRPVEKSDLFIYAQGQRYFVKQNVRVDQLQLGVMYEF